MLNGKWEVTQDRREKHQVNAGSAGVFWGLQEKGMEFRRVTGKLQANLRKVK